MPEAIDVDVQFVDEVRMACDGGNGGLGHPRVYLTMGDKDEVACPYCGARFKLKPGARITGHGH